MLNGADCINEYIYQLEPIRYLLTCLKAVSLPTLMCVYILLIIMLKMWLLLLIMENWLQVSSLTNMSDTIKLLMLRRRGL
nr:MAG TPA: hypothetical protein [Caudoviricetes sp.]